MSIVVVVPCLVVKVRSLSAAAAQFPVQTTATIRHHKQRHAAAGVGHGGDVSGKTSGIISFVFLPRPGPPRCRNTRERVEKSVGAVLGGTIRIVTTPYGGLSLDVDDEEDYALLDERHHEWIATHHATNEDQL